MAVCNALLAGLEYAASIFTAFFLNSFATVSASLIPRSINGLSRSETPYSQEDFACLTNITVFILLIYLFLCLPLLNRRPNPLRCQPFYLPIPIRLQAVAYPIVEAIGPALPKFDRDRFYYKTAPMPRAFDLLV